MANIKIGNKSIGDKEQPYFIADIAANHDGDLKRAYKLIELAKESGADAAKFQNFKADTIVSNLGFLRLDKPLSHQKNWNKSVYEVYHNAEVLDEWTPLLKEKCDSFEIEYMTSPYNFNAVDLAYDYLNAYKIGSGDISWIEILEYIAKKGKPLLLATGASNIEEVTRAVKTIQTYNKNLVLMQCNTNYTANSKNFKYINLNVLKTYKNIFGDLVLGLSDHTKGNTTVLGGIALGACVIEKHFTDDDQRIGPDHKFSTTPIEWKTMVNAANELYEALGDGIKKIEENEKETSIIQKRGVYLAKKISKGDLVTKEHLIALRPRDEKGFEPYEITNLIGRISTIDLDSGMLLKKGDII